MKKLLGVVGALLLATAGLTQYDYRLHTRPLPPTRDTLDRLSLTKAWTLRVPVLGQRDGLYSVQLIPSKEGMQLAVQTFSGAVILMDAETGDTLWRTTVGDPYWQAQPVGYNSSSIFTTRRDNLYVLNRANGRQRVYTLGRLTERPNYGFALQHAPSAQPVADEENIFFCLENRVTAYEIPDWSLIDKSAKEEGAPKTDSPQPELSWSYLSAEYHFERPPLWTSSAVGVVSTDGTFLSINKFKDTPQESRVRFDYQFHKDVSAAMGQHGDNAYIGSEDATLYALNMINGRLLWRFLSGSPIMRQPAVIDRDVFVTSSRGRGMFRVDRDTGREIWRNKEAEQFLAANKKFVYVTDRRGQLLVMDLARGIAMARYDTSEYLLPISNEWTDRIYFANHDGQILCLRHRDNAQPLRNKTFEVKKKPPKEPPEPKDKKDLDPKEKKDPDPKEKKDPDPKEKKEKDARGFSPFRLQMADSRSKNNCRLQIADCRLRNYFDQQAWIRRITPFRPNERQTIWLRPMGNLQSAICNLQSNFPCFPGV